VNGLLDGRLALITGAGSGIGAAIAHAMAKAGARIIAAGHRKAPLPNAPSRQSGRMP
jgi:3-hydroxybutyrate dehydrogenase